MLRISSRLSIALALFGLVLALPACAEGDQDGPEHHAEGDADGAGHHSGEDSDSLETRVAALGDQVAKLSVDGMSCENCTGHVSDLLMADAAVKAVVADADEDKVWVAFKSAPADLKAEEMRLVELLKKDQHVKDAYEVTRVDS